MTSFHELQSQRQDLLNELEELEEAVAELASASAVAEGDAATDEALGKKRNQHLAWLERQRAGLLVVLNETERALLGFDEPDR